MAIALLLNLDARNIERAVAALAEIELGSLEDWPNLPESAGIPISLVAAVGDHGLMPVEMDVG